jgi:hypothetical protein
MTIKIAFQTPQIDVRGTCVALYDYAHYNETILNNQSIIVVPSISIIKCVNDELAVEKFKKRFNIIFYDSNEHLENIISDCDIIYFIKYGRNNEYLSNKIKNVIHCVFDMSDPHGDVYAGVSYTLAKKFGKQLFVPHIAGLEASLTKENLRSKLNISEDKTVFGYHGGKDAFNIHFVIEAVKKVVRENENIYFIFVNIPKFDNHSNIIFLDTIVYPDEKNRFICTCDAMIHAQKLGETFGLSISEFSINNKPIITYGGSVWNDTYKNILKDKALYYYNEEDVYNIFKNFKKEDYVGKDLNCYTDYSPEKVMKIFKEVFID